MMEAEGNTSNKPLKNFVIGGTVFLGGVVLLAIVAVPMIYPLFPDTKTKRYRESRNYLRQIAIAVRMYETEHGALPRVVYDEHGRPMHSWRVLILPYFEEFEIHKRYRFEEPWDSPHNLKAAEKMPQFYGSFQSRDARSDRANFLAVYDPVQVNAKVGQLPPDAPPLILVEEPNSRILWTEPRDLPLNELPAWQCGYSRVGWRLGATQDGFVSLIRPETNLHELPR